MTADLLERGIGRAFELKRTVDAHLARGEYDAEEFREALRVLHCTSRAVVDATVEHWKRRVSDEKAEVKEVLEVRSHLREV